jgi:uncharacterized membrane protein YedE/YeeE
MAFTPVSATIGGVLIGLSASALLAFDGRVAGISGILGGVIDAAKDAGWRFMFVVGLLAGGVATFFVAPQAFGAPQTLPVWQLALGGLLVGFGTRLGNGCTSGHGVCGTSRGSPRSIAATAVFIAFGMLSVLATKGLAGN